MGLALFLFNSSEHHQETIRLVVVPFVSRNFAKSLCVHGALVATNIKALIIFAVMLGFTEEKHPSLSVRVFIVIPLSNCLYSSEPLILN